MLIRSQIPFFKQISLYNKRFKKIGDKTPTPKNRKLIPSPRVLTKFAPINLMINGNIGDTVYKSNTILARLANNGVEENKVILKKSTKELVKDDIDEGLMSLDMNTEVIRLPNFYKMNHSVMAKFKGERSEIIKSPSLYLKDGDTDSPSDEIYCNCGNPCDKNNTICDICRDSNKCTEFTGYLYSKTKSNKLKKCWYVLLNKELYCSFHESNI